MAKEAKVADSSDPVNGGQLRAFRHDGVETDILTGERFAKDPEVS